MNYNDIIGTYWRRPDPDGIFLAIPVRYIPNNGKVILMYLNIIGAALACYAPVLINYLALCYIGRNLDACF